MTYLTAQRNPYVIGRPIDEAELFFGREGLFYFIENNLKQDEKVILLFGQRRIGKSSVLHNIYRFVSSDEFVFVSFDLEDCNQQTLNSILAVIATEIVEQLELDLETVTLPLIAELKKENNIFSNIFLPKIQEKLGEKKLVLLLDEFDALNDNNSGLAFEDFFSYLNDIISLKDNLFIILFVGRRTEEPPNLLSLFKDAPYQEIGLLDEDSAERLITQPAQDMLRYEQDAINAIIELSAGHPYFTQIICFALFGRARELETGKITRADVESIVEKAIELAEAGLVWFWDGFSIPEQVFFSAVAEAQNIANETNQQVTEDPLMLLKSYGFIQTEQLIQAGKRLAQEGFLDETGCRVKIELVRRWLIQRHPLCQEIRELERQLKEEEINHVEESSNPHSALQDVE